MSKLPFHLSLPCLSIHETQAFYVDVIGASLGRHTTSWIDIDMFGNQITFTKSGDFHFNFKSYKFEDSVLPAFHYGIIVDEAIWDDIYGRISLSAYTPSEIITFLADKVGEHKSFFAEDPNRHMVEFKAFKNKKDIFSD